MNKSRKLVFAFFISAAIMNNKCLLHNNIVHASSSTPNPQSSAYNSNANVFTKYGYKGQCTWFTYGRVLEKLGISLPTEFYGNAVDWWYANSRDKVYSYGSEPKPNSIAVWGGGNYGYGHVGFVESVEGNTVYLNEGNFNIRRAYDGAVKALTKEQMKARGNLYLKGYIYMDEKTSPNNNSSSTNNNSNSTNNNSGQSSDNTEKVINTGAVNVSAGSSLNVRSGAGSSYNLVGSLGKGETVKIVGTYGDWYKIQYNSHYGYVSSKYISISGSNNTGESTSSTGQTPSTNVPTTAKSGVVALSDKSSSLNLRTNPNGEVLTTLSHGTKIEILGSNGSWYKISANGKVGYVLSAYINKTEVPNNSSGTISQSNNTPTVAGKSGTVVLSDASSTLNLRNSPWTGRVVSTLSSGSKVEVLGTNGRWYKVKVGSEVGYVHSDYVKV